MKRILSSVCALLILTACFAALLPVKAAADEAGFELKELTAHLYKEEKTETVECLFTDALPGEPYMDLAYYLGHVYTDPYTVTETDGVFVFKRDKLLIAVDYINDIVYFSDFLAVELSDRETEGTMLEVNFDIVDKATVVSDDVSVTFDFSKYGIDLIANNGKVYFPLSLLSDIFSISYCAAIYLNGDIYFIHPMEDDYFDRTEVFQKPTRDPKIIEYTYNLMCFVFDNIYGCPSNSIISDSIAEKGFDRTLEEYSDETRMAKQLLMSESVRDFYAGMFYLQKYLNDGGHTTMNFEALTAASSYPDTLHGKQVMEFFNSPEIDPEVSEMVISVNNQSAEYFWLKNNLNDARAKVYESFKTVKTWDDGISLLAKGDMAVFVFDSFVNAVNEPFMWSLAYAKENGIKNFLIDISCNGGGSTAVREFLLAAIGARQTKSNAVEIDDLDTVTNSCIKRSCLLDLNLDGKFDEKDAECIYDLNFAILTSRCSFSCGNSFPVLAKEKLGIPILGERSGGGSCIVVGEQLPDCHCFYISGCIKSVIYGKDVDFDKGAAVDYLLVKIGEEQDENGNTVRYFDFSDFYNLDLINSKIYEFYGYRTYSVTSKGAPIWDKDRKNGLSFISEAGAEAPVSVSVDGVALDKACYSVAEDGTVTLLPGYLYMLSLGDYTITLEYEKGTAETEFSIVFAGVISNGTEDVIIVCVVLMLASACAAVVTLKSRARR